MLKNRKELFNWLIKERRLDSETWIDRCNKIPDIFCIPMRYRGIYECVGTYTIWDEVGGIASSGLCYKPVKGGTILYEVN